MCIMFGSLHVNQPGNNSREYHWSSLVGSKDKDANPNIKDSSGASVQNKGGVRLECGKVESKGGRRGKHEVFYIYIFTEITRKMANMGVSLYKLVVLPYPVTVTFWTFELVASETGKTLTLFFEGNCYKPSLATVSDGYKSDWA